MTIEFFNPGKLYDELTIAQLNSGHYASRTRNRAIANMFKECGLIERYGSGIKRNKAPRGKPRGIKYAFSTRWLSASHRPKGRGIEPSEIKNACLQHGISEPVFEEFQHGFRVVIFKKENNEGVNALLALIVRHPGLRAPLLAKQMEKSTKNIERWLKQLKASDEIEFRGASKTGVYYAK